MPGNFGNGRELNVRVEGQIVCNTPSAIIAATKLGLGIGYLPDALVRDELAQKELVRVLPDWCPPFLALVCTIPAGDSLPPRLRFLSTPFVIGNS